MNSRVLFLSVLAAVTLTVSARLLGEKKCTYGPSYWCSSLSHAKECSAMQHCMTKVWNVPKAVKDDSKTCVFCQDLMTDVKNFITSNSTKDEIEQYAQTACSYMPDDYSKQTCKDVFDHYTNEIEELVENNFDPKEICTMILLCGTGNRAKAESKKVSMLGMNAAFAVLPRRVQTNENCSLCEEGASLIAKVLELKSVQTELLTVMKEGCIGLSYLEAECKALLDQYGPDVINAIGQHINGSLCKDLNVCPANLIKSVDIRNIIKTVLTNSKFPLAIGKLAANSETCTVCEEVIGYAKIFLSNKEIEQEVQQLLDDDVCPQLGNLADACKEMVNENLPKLWAELLGKLDPDTICSDLGLCSSAAVVSKVSVNMIPKVDIKPTKIETSVECVLCEFIMGKLDSMLSKNATEAEIEAALEKVCSIMPTTVRDECDQFMKQYIPEILEALAAAATPDTVCRLIGVCSGVEGKFMIPVSAMSSFGECTVCKLALQYLQESLEKKDSQAQVLAKLATICEIFADNLQQQCHGLVYKYGPEIIKAVAKDMNPDEICGTLGLCSSSTSFIGRKADGLVHLYNSNV